MSDLRDNVQQLCNEILQSFVSYQMAKSFGDNWFRIVYENAKNLISMRPDPAYNQHKSIIDLVNSKGIKQVKPQDLDITVCAMIILDENFSECSSGIDFRAIGNFKKNVKSIRTLKNQLASHITDLNNLKNYYSLCENMISVLSDCLLILKKWWSDYEYSFVFEALLKRVELAKSQCRSESGDLFTNLERRLEKACQDILVEGNDVSKEFIGLTYQSDLYSAETLSYKDLETLIDEGRSFKLSADAGYGKTFTLKMLAAHVSKMHLEHGSKTYPLFISLRDLEDEPYPIEAYLTRCYCERNKALYNSLLKEFNICLFLDAMDEVSSPEIKLSVRRELDGLVANERFTVVGTSRKRDINKFPDYKTFLVNQMNDDEAMEYINKNIPAQYREKAIFDIIKSESFLTINRIPFYLSCYKGLAEQGTIVSFTDKYQLIDLFLVSIIDREFDLLKTTIEPGRINLFLTRLVEFLDDRKEEYGSLLDFRSTQYEGLEKQIILNPQFVETALCNLNVIITSDAKIGFSFPDYRESIFRRFLMDTLSYDF